MTHACENSSFRHTSYAVGNKLPKNITYISHVVSTISADFLPDPGSYTVTICNSKQESYAYDE